MTTRAEFLAELRSDLDDEGSPPLYSDDYLTRCLNNAVREANLRARLLMADHVSHPDLCEITLVAGQADYDIDPKVLLVRYIGLVSGFSGPLQRITGKSLDRLHPGWDTRDPVESGYPQYAVMDLSPNRIRLWPTPDKTGLLLLRVWREPLDDELMAENGDEPCIDLPDPLELRHWALHEAYLKKDGERYDPERSAAHLQMFERRFGRRPSAHELTRWATARATTARAHYF